MKHVWMGLIVAIMGLAALTGCSGDGPAVSDADPLDGGTVLDDPPDRMAMAETARADGDYKVALALFREILAENPTETRAYLGIGDVYLDQSDFVGAEPYYERAARIEPRSYRAQFSYGRILQLLNRMVEAVRVYHRALALDPEGLEANLGLGATYLEMDEPEHAVAFAEKAVLVEPTNGEARANLGMVYEAVGRTDEAIEQYLIALELVDDARPAMLRLAGILIAEERYVEAVNTAESLVKLEPSGEAYALLGRARFKLGDYRDSIEAYRRSAELDASSWSAWNGVGVNALNTWLLSGKSDDEARLEARAAFRRSLRINNDQQKVIMLMQKYGLN